MKLTKQERIVINKLYDDRDIDLKESLILKKLITNNDEFFDSLPEKACDVIIGLTDILNQLPIEEWMEGLEEAVTREDYEEASIIRDLIA